MVKSKAKREKAIKESSLPYSFNYKIIRAFWGQKCPICQRTMHGGYRWCMPSVQHNIPISLGGKHEIDNVSIICLACNTSLQDKFITNKLNNDLVKKVWSVINVDLRKVPQKEKYKYDFINFLSNNANRESNNCFGNSKDYNPDEIF